MLSFSHTLPLCFSSQLPKWRILEFRHHYPVAVVQLYPRLSPGMTVQRVGLDPLVPSYLGLGANKHKMEYVASGSENIPFPDAHFDIVACLNALDHVDDLDATIREIKRVTKPGGFFLLSVEIDHPPTPTEPITLNDVVLKTFGPEFEVLSEFRVGTPCDHNLHRAVMTRLPAYVNGQPGIYVARYLRR